MWFIVLVIGCTHGYINIALKQPTNQSHVYASNRYRTSTFHSNNAVDGRKTDLSAFGGQCAVSADGHRNATWWVDLTSIHSIHDIRIYYRTDKVKWNAKNNFTGRFLGFYVYISNTTSIEDGHLCFHDTNYTRSTIPAVVNLTCPVHGQYVIYFNKRPQESTNARYFSRDAHTDLCEVEVYGCNSGFYGYNCSLSCPNPTCRYCDIKDGVCQGCKPGYQGHQCELPCNRYYYGDACKKRCACPEGTFGNYCKQNCSVNCGVPKTCNRTTGECQGGCQPGWEGLQCDQSCSSDTYGFDCLNNCSTSCINNTCDSVTGYCPKEKFPNILKLRSDIGLLKLSVSELCLQRRRLLS
ncbi:multiple epidermal growth factor-like domains protein 10 [Saccostrea echinata]|uniref:multiple epidermal growth factor-like domains protein 10 n=1 Tax=Saccostrea echinata TaxID=191078 RepID=UPI002A80C74E|nr:multiple epidermal growth factor-like domains protein 10 [Saccostrea echinata]